MQTYANKRKFEPLHMDDGEEFIMEFRGEVILEHPEDGSLIKSKVFLNFWSKSIIIEFEDSDTPECLYKYHYRFFTKAPQLVKCDSVRIKVEKIVEVPLSAVPRGYISHKSSKNSEFGIEFRWYYDKISTLMKGLSSVYEVSQNTGSEAYTMFELDIFGFFNDIRGNFEFDKTRIKNLSEKSLLDGEMRVKQILPLVSNEGILYITNKRVYFQPYQTIQANPVNYYNIK